MRLIKHEPWTHPGHLQYVIRHKTRSGIHIAGETHPIQLWLDGKALRERGSSARREVARLLRDMRRRIREIA